MGDLREKLKLLIDESYITVVQKKQQLLKYYEHVLKQSGEHISYSKWIEKHQGEEWVTSHECVESCWNCEERLEQGAEKDEECWVCDGRGETYTGVYIAEIKFWKERWLTWHSGLEEKIKLLKKELELNAKQKHTSHTKTT